MSKKEKNAKSRNGRKIVILPREKVEKVFTALDYCNELLAGIPTAHTKNEILSGEEFCKKKVNSYEITQRRLLRKKERTDAINQWKLLERNRIEKVGVIPTNEFGPVLLDTATLLKQRVDRYGIYFSEKDVKDRRKSNSELETGMDFVLEVGSFGLAYNDENQIDARGYGLSILPEDIVGLFDSTSFSYWKKRFPKMFMDEDTYQLAFAKRYGNEFDFSPVSKGVSLEKGSNVFRVNKWFHNENNIFNVLMCFYTLNKKEHVIEDGEEIEAMLVVPYLDVQLNVFVDSLQAEDIAYGLKSLIQKEKDAEIKKRYINVSNILSKINISLIRPDMGFQYRPKDAERLKYEVDENNKVIKNEKGKPIKIPADIEEWGLTRLIDENRNVIYYDDDETIIFKNGRKIG